MYIIYKYIEYIKYIGSIPTGWPNIVHLTVFRCICGIQKNVASSAQLINLRACLESRLLPWVVGEAGFQVIICYGIITIYQPYRVPYINHTHQKRGSYHVSFVPKIEGKRKSNGLGLSINGWNHQTIPNETGKILKNLCKNGIVVG